eukprot:694051-Karenia_brevis.AAC.1
MRRAVGKLKRALMEKDKERTDVIAIRSKGEVWVGKERVAKWTDQKMKLRGEGLEVKGRFEELMSAVRRPTDSLSD